MPIKTGARGEELGARKGGWVGFDSLGARYFAFGSDGVVRCCANAPYF